MFDRVLIAPPGRSQTHYHNHRSEVHEHRAPTDESVRLLKEMEEKALAKLIGSYDVESNGFTGKVAIFDDGPMLKRVAVAIFSINGHRMEARVEVDSEPGDGDKMALLTKLRDETARVISNNLLVHMMKGVRI